MRLKALAASALHFADGERAVRAALQAEPVLGPVRLLALGKAAAAMWRGAAAMLGSQLRAALVIAPMPATVADRVATPVTPQWLQGAHPIPDARSLRAGEAALHFVAATPATDTLLVLLSGGASALCECPVDGIDLPALQTLQQQLLADEVPIAQLNAVRQQLSQIKAGGLAARCALGVQVRQLLISDVPGDDIRVIGSAPFVPLAVTAERLPTAWLQRWPLLAKPRPAPTLARGVAIRSQIIASNASVRDALVQQARASNVPVRVNRSFAGELGQVAATLTQQLRDGEPGLYLFGGESHLRLPAQAGRGGRNQQLALQLALQQLDTVTWLTLASDGVDGNSDAAGAIVHGGMRRTAAEWAVASTALQRASSYDYWRRHGGLLLTGATGSNVADFVFAWKDE